LVISNEVRDLFNRSPTPRRYSGSEARQYRLEPGAALEAKPSSTGKSEAAGQIIKSTGPPAGNPCAMILANEDSGPRRQREE